MIHSPWKTISAGALRTRYNLHTLGTTTSPNNLHSNTENNIVGKYQQRIDMASASLRQALQALLDADGAADCHPPFGADDAALRSAALAALGLDPAATPAEPEPEAAPSVPRIIMDCDPGGDDVVAMFWLLALQQRNLCNVLAVTTTEGNVKAPLTFAAADKILALLAPALGGVPIDVCAQTPAAARDAGVRSTARRAYALNVAANASTPSDGLSDAAHIHGCDGMGGLSGQLAAGSVGYADAEESYERLIRELEAHPGTVTILATGPLTNLADAERARPGVLKKARRIVIMGGALAACGNITPLAEFNFAFDAEAASLVMERSGLEDILLMPLDVTTKLIATDTMTGNLLGPAVMNANLTAPALALEDNDADSETALRYEPTQRGAALFIRDLSSFMFSTALQFNETDGVTGYLVHDASTILGLFYPECLTFTRAQVSVVAAPPGGPMLPTEGLSFIDRRHTAKTAANAWVGTGIDAAGALSIMMQDLKGLLVAMPATVAATATSPGVDIARAKAAAVEAHVEAHGVAAAASTA